MVCSEHGYQYSKIDKVGQVSMGCNSWLLLCNRPSPNPVTQIIAFINAHETTYQLGGSAELAQTHLILPGLAYMSVISWQFGGWLVLDVLIHMLAVCWLSARCQSDVFLFIHQGSLGLFTHWGQKESGNTHSYLRPSMQSLLLHFISCRKSADDDFIQGTGTSLDQRCCKVLLQRMYIYEKVNNLKYFCNKFSTRNLDDWNF